MAKKVEFKQGSRVVFALTPGSDVGAGRHATNEWVINDSSASRFHVRLTWPKGDPRPQLVDLGSANGTFLDDLRVPVQQPVVLTDGASLTLGEVEVAVRVHVDETGPALLDDDELSSSAVFLGGKVETFSGRFVTWDDARELFMSLENEQRTGELTLELGGGSVSWVFLLGAAVTDRTSGVTLLQRIRDNPMGVRYSYTSELKFGTQPTRGWLPNELLALVEDLNQDYQTERIKIDRAALRRYHEESGA